MSLQEWIVVTDGITRLGCAGAVGRVSHLTPFNWLAAEPHPPVLRAHSDLPVSEVEGDGHVSTGSNCAQLHSCWEGRRGGGVRGGLGDREYTHQSQG